MRSQRNVRFEQLCEMQERKKAIHTANHRKFVSVKYHEAMTENGQKDILLLSTDQLPPKRNLLSGFGQ